MTAVDIHSVSAEGQRQFRAYPAGTAKADRVAYYTDLVGIFEELEIPWQHWFMLLDGAGTLDPDMAAAFGLD